MNELGAWDVLLELFAAVLSAAVLALPLAGAAWAIDAGLRRRVAPRWRCWLWTLVAVRLVLPVAPASSWSWHTLWSGTANATAPWNMTPSRRDPDLAPVDAVVVAQWADAWAGSAPAQPVPPVVASVNWSTVLMQTLALAWLAGALFVGLRALGASWRFGRRLQSIPDLADARLASLLARCCQQIGVRPPAVKVVADVSSPALFGACRPTLCLPGDAVDVLSDAELQMIFLHEAAHLRRGDGWRSWLVAAMHAVQWFNPVAWLAVRRIGEARELACDEVVRQLTEPEQRDGYAELLLRFANRRPRMSMGLVGLAFARPGGPLGERVVAIRSAGARRRLPATVAIAALVALSLFGLTDCPEQESRAANSMTISESMSAPRTDVADVSANPTIGFAPYPPGEALATEPQVQRAYDVRTAAGKLVEANAQRQPYDAILAYAKLAQFGAKSVRYDDAVPYKLWVEMPASGHAGFASLLASLAKSGGWQVTVTSRCFSTPHLESLAGIDWQRAVRFPMRADDSHGNSTNNESFGKVAAAGENANLTVQAETISQSYAPYLAVVVDEPTHQDIINQIQNDPRASARFNPNITMFSGTRGTIHVGRQSPFVVGVHYIEGAHATATQPDIAIVSEGVQMEVSPQVIDAQTLALGCKVTTSTIDSVAELNLPDGKTCVQSPRVSLQSIAATCRLREGEALIIAPLVGRQDDDEKPEPLQLYAVTAEWFLDDGFDDRNSEE